MNIKSFVIGVTLSISMFVLYGLNASEKSESNSIGRYIPITIENNRSGLFIVDTSTGETKIVWGTLEGGQTGMPFTEMSLHPASPIRMK